MRGFRLTQEVRDEPGGYQGGSVLCSTLGHAFDVGAALTRTYDSAEEGQGQVTAIDPQAVIYTNDPTLAAVLDQYPALESVPVNEIPEDAQAVELPYRVEELASTPAPNVSNVMPGTEIPAEHVDDPGSVEGAIAAGEAVAGPPAEETPPQEPRSASRSRRGSPTPGEPAPAQPPSN